MIWNPATQIPWCLSNPLGADSQPGTPSLQGKEILSLIITHPANCTANVFRDSNVQPIHLQCHKEVSDGHASYMMTRHWPRLNVVSEMCSLNLCTQNGQTSNIPFFRYPSAIYWWTVFPHLSLIWYTTSLGFINRSFLVRKTIIQ